VEFGFGSSNGWVQIRSAQMLAVLGQVGPLLSLITHPHEGFVEQAAFIINQVAHLQHHGMIHSIVHLYVY
jgi:hypothetical protein